MKSIPALETALGYVFMRPELLRMALTHSSFANEHGLPHHNERLEFLGDAVLALCVSASLYARFPQAREGDMTRIRSHLVSSPFLAKVAQELCLEHYLMLGKGEENQGGRQREALLSDALEAILGAVFEDGGFMAVSGVLEHILREHWPAHAERVLHKDYKTLLQEATQRTHKERPVYMLASSSGPEHAKCFEVRLFLPDGRTFAATGPSVKRAEQETARMALEHDTTPRTQSSAMP